MTTFSPPYIRDHFHLSVEEAFSQLLDLKLGLVRISCYWNEIEKTKDQYDFSQIVTLLQMAEKANQKIVLTVGMKAVRWPEFYLPNWTSFNAIIKNPEALFRFIEKTINIVTKFSCVKYLQIENAAKFGNYINSFFYKSK